MSPESSGGGDCQASWPDVAPLCDAALDIYEWEGREGEAKKLLDTALAAATPGENEARNSADCYRRIVSFAMIANTAHTTGQPAEYVRVALDGAIAVSEAKDQPSPIPNLDTGALSNIMNIAHKTGQGPAYIEPVFELVRKQVMAQAGTDPSFAWKFGNLIRSANRYGLGNDYVLELLEEGRAGADELTDTSLRIDFLSTVARLSSEVRDEPDYGIDVLSEAEDVIEEEISDKGTRARYLSELACTAQKAGLPEDYVQDLLRDSLRQGISAFAEDADIIAARSLKTALRACAKLKQAELGEVFARRSVSYLERTLAGTPRAKHKLLNGLVWDAGLSEDFTAGGLIEKRPLSYVFKA